ncbi:hypothetical protein NQZ68_007637 [Dissostichus eleginoides]|nr:hypothetical protein NQZ68_007637 [Dissostichus eleginoides]
MKAAAHLQLSLSEQLLLLDSAQTHSSFSWKLCYLLSFLYKLTGDIIYTLEVEECVCLFVCVRVLAHAESRCEGPEQGLKGNFDPVEISPLRRVSSDQF